MKIKYLNDSSNKTFELFLDENKKSYFIDNNRQKNYSYFFHPEGFEVVEYCSNSNNHDVVNNPKHYQLVEGFEVKDLMKLLLNRIENSDIGFTHFQSSCYKEAMQYFLRFMLKNGQEDIQKGVYYMNEVLKEWQEHPE